MVNQEDSERLRPASADVSVVSPDQAGDVADSSLDEVEEEAVGNEPAETLFDSSEDEETGRSGFLEWGIVLASAVVLALILRTFLIAAFWIPSESMLPTLQEHDRVLVNKTSYRFGDVSRGDIIVFRHPNPPPGETKDLIKRAIGLPGETLEVRDSQVYIDGQPLEEEYLSGDSTYPDFGPVTIPDGEIFFMGDNRGNSRDSRFELGTVPEGQIVGRAFVRFWPLRRIGGL